MASNALIRTNNRDSSLRGYQVVLNYHPIQIHWLTIWPTNWNITQLVFNWHWILKLNIEIKMLKLDIEIKILKWILKLKYWNWIMKLEYWNWRSLSWLMIAVENKYFFKFFIIANLKVVAYLVGFYPDPDPTFKKKGSKSNPWETKMDPDPWHYFRHESQFWLIFYYCIISLVNKYCKISMLGFYQSLIGQIDWLIDCLNSLPNLKL